MSNINDSFFDGQYKDIWKALIPEELTIRETKFFIEYFNLKPGQHVLDLMCGYGRHAISLARNGIHVTAVDNLQDYINEIRDRTFLENLPIEAIQSDLLTFEYTENKYDLVICMGNSLNFFNQNDTNFIFKKLANALKPGGYLVINTWSLAEIVYHKFPESSEGNVGFFKISSLSKFLIQPSRIETTTKMTSSDGIEENKMAIDYIFSINEIDKSLNKNNLKLIKIYSIPGIRVFSLGDPRAYIIAKKT